MNKKQLEELVKQINDKIGNVEELTQKAQVSSQVLTDASALLQQLKQQQQVVESVTQGVNEISSNVKQHYENIKNSSDVATKYTDEIEKQKKDNDELVKNIKQLTERSEVLLRTSDDQLGRISSQVLANSFQGEGGKLDESVQKWFSWLWATTLGLLIIAGVIVFIQLHGGGDLLEYGFLVKIALTSPVIYFITFLANQYSREKKLLEEYRFKATIALSFEAYRKLLREEVAALQINDEKKQERVLDFIVESVSNIYSSPMKNISENKHSKKDTVDEVNASQISTIREIVTEIVSSKLGK